MAKDLTVPAGATCTLLPGTHVTHDVNVGAGSTLVCTQAAIDHDLTFKNSAGVELQDCSVGHDVRIGGLAGPGTSSVCGTTVGHDLDVTGATGGRISIGAAPACPSGNTIGHDLTVTGNADGPAVDRNRAGHDITVTSNTGGTTVGSGNAAGHAVTINRNS